MKKIKVFSQGRVYRAFRSRLAFPSRNVPTSSVTAEPARLELVCPAGSLPALRAAVDEGADCVYLGLRDATNARNFAGLNFDEKAIAEGIRYAHGRGRKVLMAINTYPRAGRSGPLAGAPSTPPPPWASTR